MSFQNFTAIGRPVQHTQSEPITTFTRPRPQKWVRVVILPGLYSRLVVTEAAVWWNVIGCSSDSSARCEEMISYVKMLQDSRRVFHTAVTGIFLCDSHSCLPRDFAAGY